jgi:ankyrin repeat protein
MPDLRISLMFSIEKGKNDKAKELVREVGVNTEIKDYGTPLLIACLHDNSEMAKFFLDLGANVNVTNGDGDTPLILASDKGNTDLVKALIAKGAEVNAQNKYQMTPIMKAISGHAENLELIEYLLKSGADPFIKVKGYENHPGKIADNAYELADYLGHEKVVALIDKYANKKK